MRIDHIIYAAPNLAAAVDDVERRLGVRAAGGGPHPGRGTHNELLSLGPGTFLELIAPDPAQPAVWRWFGVEGVTRPGFVGWALACDDIETATERSGLPFGDIVNGQRVAPDGSTVRWRLTSNARVGGLIPFLINWGNTPHPSLSAPAGLALDAFHIEHPDPESLSAQLATLGADVEVREAARPAMVATVSGPGGVFELR